MIYELLFHEKALKEWRKLDSNTQEQFKKKLKERLDNPHNASAKLTKSQNRYKIKLKSAGYRLVYEVQDAKLVVTVIAVGRRDQNLGYIYCVH